MLIPDCQIELFMLKWLAPWRCGLGDVTCGLAIQLNLQITVENSVQQLNQSEPEGGGSGSEEAGPRHNTLRARLRPPLAVLRFQVTSRIRT